MSEHMIGNWWTGGEVSLPPEAELNETLRWLIDQLSLGFFESLPDERGRTTTIVIGEKTAPRCSSEEAVEHFRRRHLAVNIAQLFAAAREKGVDPTGVEAADHVRFGADENGYLNTEFHYALELMTILKVIRGRSFELTNLPLIGHASPELVALLQEATRSHLFGLHIASVALCRAVMERALTEKVPAEALEAQRTRQTKNRHNREMGYLELLIATAQRLQLLDTFLSDVAHRIRIRANDALHGQATSNDSFVTLQDTRTIVERLFTTSGTA